MNKLFLHLYNWWLKIKLQPQRFNKNIKHYVRIVKVSPKPTELIEEIKSDQLSIAINENGELVSTASVENKNQQCHCHSIVFNAEIGNNEDGAYLELKRPNENTPVILPLNMVKDLNINEEQIQFIYTNIKIYGKNKKYRRAL